ncbi:phosphatidylserine decarboxylase [Nematocida sp. AWRm80]|nr:phosphatidylserine decarboxylase [Nematocida sp. AWRm80]
MSYLALIRIPRIRNRRNSPKRLSRSKISKRIKKTAGTVLTLFIIAAIVNIIEDKYCLEDYLGVHYSIIRTFPLRTYSRFIGWICKIRYPWPLNILMVGLPKMLLRISLKEAEYQNISAYASINDLFTRRMSPKHLLIGAGIVSPATGTIIHANLIGRGSPKIKGVIYREEDLLKIDDLWSKRKMNGDMYQIIIYLSPRDYHRFHCYSEFRLREIKHIPSQLFSVGKIPMRYIKGLLSKNERVVFSGKSPWGYASLVAVGSTGVGSISTPRAKIRTNSFCNPFTIVSYLDNKLFDKGEEMGRFNLGSTVVLIFEAPKTFKLLRTKGPIKVGETLGI